VAGNQGTGLLKLVIPKPSVSGNAGICNASAEESFATVLERIGERMKVAQELLRHAHIQTTMSVYTGAMEKDKREAANRVAEALLGSLQMRGGTRYCTQTNPAV
jgi:hypothetical protein